MSVSLSRKKKELLEGRYTEEQFRDFIKYIFNMLYNNDLCFSSGTFIINDSNDLFFNLLLYNEFIPSKNKVSVANLAPIHLTHNEPIRGIEKELYLDKHPAQKFLRKTISHNKYERRFNPPITGLCNGAAEDKGVCLFYKFKSPSDNNNYLFLKFESAPMLSIAHVLKASHHYANESSKSSSDNEDTESEDNASLNDHIELNVRRETHKQCSRDFYNETYSKNDKLFYRNEVNPLCGMSGLERGGNPNFKELDHYNSIVRVGCEFYITEPFMINLAISFVKTFKQPVDDESARFDLKKEYADHFDQVPPELLDNLGGSKIRRKKQNKYHSKKNKKQQKRRRYKTMKSFF
jgi:hypothetical protein